VVHDGQHLTVTGEVSWRFEEGKIKAGEREDIYHDGTLDVDVVVKLRRKEAEVKEYVRSLFLSARQICCCDKTVDLGKLSSASVTYERPLDRALRSTAARRVRRGCRRAGGSHPRSATRWCAARPARPACRSVRAATRRPMRSRSGSPRSSRPWRRR
jgi:hypothetical protein